MKKTKSDEPKLRPRSKEFTKVSSGLIFRILQNLNPIDEGGLSTIPKIVYDMGDDLAKWASDKITDKALCGRLFNHWHNLTVLFSLFGQEKEVVDLVEARRAYEEEYARRNPDPDDEESPF